MFSDSLRAEYAVLPPSINIVAISEEASGNAIWTFERTLTRIREIKKVFTVSPGASKK